MPEHQELQVTPRCDVCACLQSF